MSAETAAWAASWAQGLATVAQEPAALQRVVDAYRSAGGAGPCILQVHLSMAKTDDEAFAIAREQWKNGLLSPPVTWELEQPEDFDAAVAGLDEHDLRKCVLVDDDAASLADRIADLAQIGFDRAYLHHVGTDQSWFLDAAASELIPALKDRM